MEHRRTRQLILVSVVAALAIVALIVTAIASCTPEPDEAPSPTRPAATTTEPSTEPSTEPREEPTEEPTTEEPAGPEQPAAIVLSGDGIGDIPMGTADPRPTLVELFGPPSDEWSDVPCGPGGIDALVWDALIVNLADGALWGWDIDGLGLPAGVTTGSGVMPGAPLTDAMALPGATAPEYRESMDAVVVGADEVWYWGPGSDPAATTISRIAVNGITCD